MVQDIPKRVRFRTEGWLLRGGRKDCYINAPRGAVERRSKTCSDYRDNHNVFHVLHDNLNKWE